MLTVQMKRLRLLLFVSLAFVSAACHKSVSAPPALAATPPPPAQPLVPPTIALSADRTTITQGQAVTLTWRSTNATTVTMDNSIGSVGMSGSRQVTPATSATYTATAIGAGGNAMSAPLRVTVNVIPAPAAQPAPSRLQPNPSPTLAEQFQTTMQNIHFDYDKSTLGNSEIPKLQAGAKWLIRNPSIRFTIEGNADERGSQEYNIALGDERAAVVRKYLSDQGVLEARMEAISYGEERPLCREPNEDCRQKNRRAQFVMKP